MNDTTVPDTDAKAANDRAKVIAGLHEFADWLAANPWAPIARTGGYLAKARFQVDLHGPGPIGTGADIATVDRVREIADRMGVKVDETGDDRTDASIEIGSVSYSVIAWHKGGRPGEPDERDAELARLRAEVAELQAARRSLGLDYSRTDSEPDDPMPVSPARVPLHVAIREKDGAKLLELPAAEPLHYLDYGSNGEDTDRVACGERVTGIEGYVEDLAEATCMACRSAMEPF